MLFRSLAFGKRKPLLVLACALCPLIDERFIFGVPCALVIRNWSDEPSEFNAVARKSITQCVLAFSPFIVVRVAGLLFVHQVAVDRQFFMNGITGSVAYLWIAPLGIWMGLRIAYLPIVLRAYEAFATNPRMILLLLFAAFGPVALGIPLAADTTRTAGILLPLATWSIMKTCDHYGKGLWIALALTSLFFSAAQVTYTKIMPINSLPVELWRLMR